MSNFIRQRLFLLLRLYHLTFFVNWWFTFVLKLIFTFDLKFIFTFVLKLIFTFAYSSINFLGNFVQMCLFKQRKSLSRVSINTSDKLFSPELLSLLKPVFFSFVLYEFKLSNSSEISFFQVLKHPRSAYFPQYIIQNYNDVDGHDRYD